MSNQLPPDMVIAVRRLSQALGDPKELLAKIGQSVEAALIEKAAELLLRHNYAQTRKDAKFKRQRSATPLPAVVQVPEDKDSYSTLRTAAILLDSLVPQDRWEQFGHLPQALRSLAATMRSAPEAPVQGKETPYYISGPYTTGEHAGQYGVAEVNTGRIVHFFKPCEFPTCAPHHPCTKPCFRNSGEKPA